MSKVDIPFLEHKAYNLRVNSVRATTAAGSGHVTSALSAADMVAAIFFHALRYNIQNPDDPSNDRFILSKGHAAPLLYAVWKEMGILSEEELLNLRQFDSVLEGHPTPRFRYTEAATGSLGCGLSFGVGMALSCRLSNQEFYTYVLLGDSETSEGSVWEACEVAAYYKADNLIALVDLNRLGQSTETIDNHNIAKHEAKWKAFGWHTIAINGHDLCAIVNALDEAKKVDGKPIVIIAYTFKGYGVKAVEDKDGYHGKPFSKEELPHILEELRQRFKKAAEYNDIPSIPALVRIDRTKPKKNLVQLPLCHYEKGEKIATRKAYGQTLAVLGDYSSEVICLDAEVKNSTFADIFEKKYPHRFFQCFIAEQNMIGMSVGFASRGYIPFSSTFASFLTRAHDQIRMAAIGRSPLRIAGTHCGVSIGQDGPSQMGLEDIAQMRAIPESIVLYPSDAVSTCALVNIMVNYQEGISYIRLTRAETQVMYTPEDTFVLGGCKVLKESDKDELCIVAAGITLFEALKAYEKLKQEGICVSVIDLYSIKPLDRTTLHAQAVRAQRRLITVEDHYMQGGLGEAVCYALRNENIKIEVLAVQELSRSGRPEELLAYHKIDEHAIKQKVYMMLDRRQ